MTNGMHSELTSVVIPTFNEIKNIGLLIGELDESLQSIAHEIIIVDDNSPDGTGQRAEELAGQYPLTVLHRKRKMGLASAVLQGFDAAKGTIVACMDADFSHPPRIMPELIKPLLQDDVDMTVASRLVDGGGVIGEWPQRRRLNSYAGSLLARPLTSIKDCMSGYFALKKAVIEDVKLVPRGYKIGLEIIVKGKAKHIKEVPFVFDNRADGDSKLDLKVQIQYLIQIGHLYAYCLRRAFRPGKT